MAFKLLLSIHVAFQAVQNTCTNTLVGLRNILLSGTGGSKIVGINMGNKNKNQNEFDSNLVGLNFHTLVKDLINA